jgi:hypothetical protein
MRAAKREAEAVTAQAYVIGVDLGDKWSRYCAVDAAGAVLDEDRVRTTADGLRERFGELSAKRIVIEAGTHSPWVSRVRAESKIASTLPTL